MATGALAVRLRCIEQVSFAVVMNQAGPHRDWQGCRQLYEYDRHSMLSLQACSIKRVSLLSLVLQVIAVDTIWQHNTATSGGGLFMYEFSRLSMHNNTLQQNKGASASCYTAQ